MARKISARDLEFAPWLITVAEQQANRPTITRRRKRPLGLHDGEPWSCVCTECSAWIAQQSNPNGSTQENHNG